MRAVGQHLDQVQLMHADGIPHNKLCAAAGPACVDLGVRVERVAVQRDGIVKVGDGAVQRGQQAAVDRVEVFAHSPIQLSAVGQGEAAQRGKDQGRGDKDTDMGCAVCAGQGRGVGDGDRVGSLGAQGQRVANAVPPGIGRIVTGNALQYIRRQGHGIGGRRAEHHLPPRGVDEQKALDVGHRAHRVELGGQCRVHRRRPVAGGVAGQQVGAHAGVVGAPAGQVVDLIHIPADGRDAAVCRAYSAFRIVVRSHSAVIWSILLAAMTRDAPSVKNIVSASTRAWIPLRRNFSLSMKAPLCKYVNKNADHAGKRGGKTWQFYLDIITNA